MADTLGALAGNLGLGGSGGLTTLITAIVIGVIVLILGGSAIYLFYKKSLWNLDVEFKFMRSDGTLVTAEWGKGMFDVKRGVVFIKRKIKGTKKVPMPPFDVKRYLQGSKILTVMQVGIEQYVPVLPESFLEMIDSETGENAALMKFKVDLTESRAWRNQFEREAKQAYTILGLLQQYANFIGIGLILMMQLIGFAILYTRIVG